MAVGIGLDHRAQKRLIIDHRQDAATSDSKATASISSQLPTFWMEAAHMVHQVLGFHVLSVGQLRGRDTERPGREAELMMVNGATRPIRPFAAGART